MRKAIRTHRGLALFGGALVLATLTSLHLYLNWRLYAETATYGSIWLAEAIEWTIWAAFVPVVWAFERRLGTATGKLARAILGHAVVLLAFYGLLSILMTGVGWPSGRPHSKAARSGSSGCSASSIMRPRPCSSTA